MFLPGNAELASLIQCVRTPEVWSMITVIWIWMFFMSPTRFNFVFLVWRNIFGVCCHVMPVTMIVHACSFARTISLDIWNDKPMKPFQQYGTGTVSSHNYVLPHCALQFLVRQPCVLQGKQLNEQPWMGLGKTCLNIFEHLSYQYLLSTWGRLGKRILFRVLQLAIVVRIADCKMPDCDMQMGCRWNEHIP